MLIEMTTQVDVDIDAVWESIWGNDGNGFAYWVGAVRDIDGKAFNAYLDTDKDVSSWKPNPHGFKIYDSYDDYWHFVTLDKLAHGYLKAVKSGLTHCNGCALDDEDACTEDIFMQYAVFGEVIYG